MYGKTVTIFNLYESPITNEAKWYPHVIEHVDLIEDRGAILKKYGPDSKDNAVLHIRCLVDGGESRITDKNGTVLLYRTPREWSEQVNDELPLSITFGSGDFFATGDYGSDVIPDADYPAGLYQHLNSARDGVYKITSVGMYTLIPHFEILGR